MSSWSDKATQALLSIWGQENIQNAFDGTRRNSSIYSEITEKLKEAGFTFTTKQVINKCKNLRRQYTAAKDDNNKSGNAPTDWVYFGEMDAIFGDRPVSKPQHIIDGMDDKTFAGLDDSLVFESSHEEGGLLLDLLQDDDSQDDGAPDVSGIAGPAENKKRKAEDDKDKKTSRTSLKSRKKAKVEEMVSEFTDAMAKVSKDFGEVNRQHQMEMQQNVFRYEDRRRREEAEERRRDEERAHERQMQLLSMFGQMFAGRSTQPVQPTQGPLPYSAPAVYHHPNYPSAQAQRPSTSHQRPDDEIHKPWL